MHTVQDSDQDYIRAQQFRVLFRTLSANIVRELNAAGCRGHDLLAFVNEFMRAITDDGCWARGPAIEGTRQSESIQVPAAAQVSSDQHDRPTLVTKRLILRPPSVSDKPHLLRWQKDKLVNASLIPPVLQHVTRQLANLHEQRDRVDLVICDRSSGEPAGLVTLHDIDREACQAELGKVIGEPAFRRRGLAEEAARQIIAFGIEALGLNRIYLRTLGANIMNIRLNERMGFRFEGVLRQVQLTGREPVDVVLMAMLRSDISPDDPLR